MIKNVLTHIGGIGLYGVISICLFFAVFTGALIWSMLLQKADLDSRSALPFDDGVRPSSAAASQADQATGGGSCMMEPSIDAASGNSRATRQQPANSI